MEKPNRGVRESDKKRHDSEKLEILPRIEQRSEF
jgi:hypothetical protein